MLRSARADAENLTNHLYPCDWSNVRAPLRTTRRSGWHRAFTLLFASRFESAIYDGYIADEKFSANPTGAAWVNGSPAILVEVGLCFAGGDS